jgi:serine/threonine protein phosphatase PrpC
LSELDLRIQATGGQSTAVIAVVRSDRVSGASVGDSGALHCKNGDVDELTRGQRSKPLVGSGSAVPVRFRASPLDGTLLVATDGLLKYANWARLVETLGHPQLNEIPELLVSLVRLRPGALQDDVGIVVCRASTRLRPAIALHRRQKHAMRRANVR